MMLADMTANVTAEAAEVLKNVEAVSSGWGVLELFEKGGMPKAIVDARGLGQVSDTGALQAMVEQAIAANPKSVEDFKAGKKAAAGFFVGQVMKLSKGKADPKIVGKMVAETLSRI